MFYSGRREKDAFNEFNRLSVNMVLISESEASSEPEVHVQSVFYHHNNFIKTGSCNHPTLQHFTIWHGFNFILYLCAFLPTTYSSSFISGKPFPGNSLHQRDDNNCVGHCWWNKEKMFSISCGGCEGFERSDCVKLSSEGTDDGRLTPWSPKTKKFGDRRDTDVFILIKCWH